MPIAREGRFLLTHDLVPGITSLGLETAMLDACIGEVQCQGYGAVFGNPAYGFRELTLDALRHLPELRHIWFWDMRLNNIEGLYALQKLESFGVHQERPPIAFDRLPALRQMVWMHRPRDSGVESLSLERLNLWRYAPTQRSFANLRLPETLQSLGLFWCNADSLAGFPALPKLRNLEIARCRNLSSLAELPDLFPALEHLVISACGRMSAEEGDRVVARMPGLKHAFVQTRVVT